MIDRLVRGLAMGTELTNEEILDVLWLAAIHPASQSPPQDEQDEQDAAIPTQREADEPASADSDIEPVLAAEAPLPLHMDVERSRSGQRVPATEVGFGAPRPIQDALTLPMALRRLRRVRTPGRDLAVDIDATVDATAEAGRLLPVLRSPQHRALDLAIVVDDSWSMRIWNDTFDDLERLLGQTGAFRAVSRWRLSPGSGTIRPDTRSAARSAAHPAERLIDPSGRRLVLVATDAGDAAWQAVAAWEAVAAWCAAMPTVLVQVLPPHYWTGTAIGDPYITARARRPAAPNGQYERRVAWWAEGDDPGGLPLPVITLDPSALDVWSRAVIDGTAWSTGITAIPPDPGYSPAASAGLTADALVNGFFSRASSGAQRLARILAGAATLSMPLIAVLRDRLAPETGVLELAEILASGLLAEVRPAGVEGQPLLRFRPGIRAILQRGTTVLEEWDAYSAVSRYLEDRQRLGGSLRALVRDPAGSATLDADDEPFAELQQTLATRLGLGKAAAEAPTPAHGRRDAVEQAAVPADAPSAEPELQAEHGQALDAEDGHAIDPGLDSPDDELPEFPPTETGLLAGDVVTGDVVTGALSHELEQLTGDTAFTVAEFAMDAVTIFEISRDEHGTPVAVAWKYPYDDGVLRIEKPDRWSDALGDPERFNQRVAPKLIVHPPTPLPGFIGDLRLGLSYQVPSYECPAPLREMLRTAVRESPLRVGYELAVLTHGPDGHTSTELVLTGLPLFPPGATQGQQVRIQVHCEPTDANGTAFAIVTRPSRVDVAPHAWPLRPLQIQASVVPPGSYDLTAVLTRPGRVRFEGLPAPLDSSPGRSWEDLKRIVPGQVSARGPVHLVCLIEVSGAADRLEQRIELLGQLITTAWGSGPLRVSVIAYGAHGVAWRVEDKPPEVRVWAVPGSQAISALRALAKRRTDELEYLRAAQLECALRLLQEPLAEMDERSVIVAAGGRPGHPPRLDTRNQLIPCPDRVDGVSQIRPAAGRSGHCVWRTPGFAAPRPDMGTSRTGRRGPGRRRGGHGSLRVEPWPGRSRAGGAVPGNRAVRNPECRLGCTRLSWASPCWGRQGAASRHSSAPCGKRSSSKTKTGCSSLATPRRSRRWTKCPTRWSARAAFRYQRAASTSSAGL